MSGDTGDSGVVLNFYKGLLKAAFHDHAHKNAPIN